MITLFSGGSSLSAGFITLIIILVAIFAGILLALFLRKRTLPVINLMFIRLLHGRYSYKYLEFFKQNDLRNPLNNCIKDEITLHFSVFFTLLKNAVRFKTDTPIDFKDVPFLITYKKLVKRLGIPNCINIARFHNSRVKVVGYNELFQNKKMKSLFYFIENQFVMGEFVFSESRRMDPTPIKEALSKKYLDGKALQSDTVYITGPEGNLLNYHDNGFYASVKYLYRGNEYLNQIMDDVFSQADSNGQAFKNAMIQEELLNRF